MAVKKWIASRITALYYDAAAAEAAEEHFRRTVQEKQFSEDDITEITVPDEYKAGGLRLADMLAELKLLPSKSEVRRLIEGGGLKLGGETVHDFFAHYEYASGVILQLGKRKVYRLL